LGPYHAESDEAESRRVDDESPVTEPEPDKIWIHNEIDSSSGLVLQTGAVHGNIYLHGTEPAPYPLIPHQLPATVHHFISRHDEKNMLTTLLDTAASEKTVVISAIDGTAGIGKTTLALHWGHQTQDRFPEGELYVNLRGFDPTGEPMSPSEALRRFLDALGVPKERIPTDTDAQAALYRSLVHNRRMLVVLDNAVNSEQVRPLLPASSMCLTLVTSRNQLSGLVIRDGAHRLRLDFLSTLEALDLLVSHIGEAKIDAELDAASELVERCAHLPLALSIVAARAASRPQFPLTALVDELRDERDRLDALDAGGDMSVRVVFSCSYRTLSAEAARAFRLLGLAIGADISLGATAALLGARERPVRRLLEELGRMHLLEHYLPNRYRFHDLLRLYAAERAEADESNAGRRSALRRLLDWYLHTSYNADKYFGPHRSPANPDIPDPEITLHEISSYRQAVAWFAAEHAALLAATRLAFDHSFDEHAWQLPLAMHAFLERQGHWLDLATANESAWRSALRTDNRNAQAHTAHNLGRTYARFHRFDDCDHYLQRAFALYQELDDQAGQAEVHEAMGQLSDFSGRHSEAILHAQSALDIFRAIGDRQGEASALDQVGWNFAQLGDFERALPLCQQALPMLHQLGDSHREADTLDSLGYIHDSLGHYPEAISHFQRAIALWRALEDHYNKAKTLVRLGDTYHTVGDDIPAGNAWREALAALDKISQPGAETVRVKLAALEHRDL
jgi:tetratricopeptide (TPR) repeat protein